MLLAGCETKPPAPRATSEEREQALSALNACLQAAARKLDDGRSEASTVALALRPSCAAEFARSRDASARSLNSQQASQAYTEWMIKRSNRQQQPPLLKSEHNDDNEVARSLRVS